MYPNQRQINEVTLILATYDKFRDKANIIKFHTINKKYTNLCNTATTKIQTWASFMSLLVTEIHAWYVKIFS